MRVPLLLAVLVVLPSPALAQDVDGSALPTSPGPITPASSPTPPADPTAHRHLGFFFRADVGVGYVWSGASEGGTTVSVSSIAVPVGFAVGGAVAENWILAGEGWGSYGPSPRLKFGSSSASASDTEFYVTGFGLAVVHYFMPANVYLSLTPGVSRLTSQSGGSTGQTQLGFGAKLAVGKEWWVSDHWGLGIAVEALFALNNDQGAGAPAWTTLGGGLTFSATYN